MKSLVVGKTTLLLKQGDITLEDVDAIVNAANSTLMGGGGVDGAIHRAGGPAILDECKRIRHKQGALPTGEAVITTGGRLIARHVIHTVGPVWRGGTQNEEKLLANAYRNSLQIAVKNHLASIAFPSISTGIYGFPIVRAAEIALTTVLAFVKTETSLEGVRYITFSETDYGVYASLFADVGR